MFDWFLNTPVHCKSSFVIQPNYNDEKIRKSNMRFLCQLDSNWNCFCYSSFREKCPNTEFFLLHIFSHSDWIWRDTSFLSVFSLNAGKYRPEKTPYLNTFHTVLAILTFSSWINGSCMNAYLRLQFLFNL